jgi:anti-sigma-K factor RskA
MTDHDRLGELAGPYALGALGEDDRRAFEAHLATCAECRREVRDGALVAEGLGRAVDPREPPAGLRERVIAAAVAPAKREPQLEDSRTSWLLLAASLAAVAFGLYAWTLQTRLQTTDAALRSAQAELAALESQLTQSRRDTDEAKRTADVLFAPDVVVVTLAGQAAAPQATGRAGWCSRRTVFRRCRPAACISCGW